MSDEKMGLNNSRIGIVGCGHLGQSLAQALINHGIPKQNLMVSFQGNPDTYQRLADKDLTSCLTENRLIFKKAHIILIATKPQDITGLGEILTGNATLVVSCMSGIPIKLLNNFFKTEVHRMMFSGPDTILSEKGVATAYPRNEILESLISLLRLRYIPIDSEEEMDVFTAGVCMPAAILMLKDMDGAAKEVDRMSDEYPLINQLFGWVKKVLPEFRSKEQKEEYIQRMITKGGITEAIIKSLQSCESFDASLRKGITRTKQISLEIQKSILTHNEDII